MQNPEELNLAAGNAGVESSGAGAGAGAAAAAAALF